MRKNKFVLDISKVMSGIFLINILSVITLPIITRIYGTTVYGAYSSVLALLNILVSVSTLKYELAIVIPKSKYAGKMLLRLAVVIMMVFSGLVLLSLLFFNGPIAKNLQVSRSVAFLLPILIALTAIKPVYQAWFSRNQEYGLISKNHITDQLITKLGTIVAGLISPTVWSLVIMYSAGKLFTTFNLIRLSKVNFRKVKTKFLLGYMRKYKKFAIFSTPATLANVTSTQAPILLLSHFFGVEIVAFYAVIQRLISMPIGLVQQSLGQVYYERAAKEINKKGHATSITIKLMLVLSSIGIVAGVFLYFLGPPIFSFFIGNRWADASPYLILLLPFFLFRFIKSPINYWTLINRQELTLIFNVLQFLLTVISFWLFHETPKQAIFSFSLFMAAFYISNILFIIIHSVQIKRRSQVGR
ncbi:lipopolysaccharide biosynthesis protein [Tuberibacillus sp. Marseille-P3662]|uniref:lipopolysaccharide biosynthesis protein n=1 Tax=Tuberibacillus sp. Marseille-P3662 TaxID=1965358 RepID=UPI000A1CCC46|nr:oligosaccharide flippase family protein [Tuberibacillus sp. Marseille-P3662]